MNKTATFFGYDYLDLVHFIFKIGANLLISTLILVVGFWLSNVLGKFTSKLLRRSKTDEGLITFLSSFVVLASKVLVIVTAITQLGVAMTSFVTILGAAGIAIGMAFSGTLSNFAGGIMILVLKPFKVKDTILAQNVQGVVNEIQIFNTYLTTSDNKVVILPNGPLANGTIINFSKAEKRKIEIVVPIRYGDNLDGIMETLKESFLLDEKILKDPQPSIQLTQLGEEKASLSIQVWVKNINFIAVSNSVNAIVYRLVSSEGYLNVKNQND